VYLAQCVVGVCYRNAHSSKIVHPMCQLLTVYSQWALMLWRCMFLQESLVDLVATAVSAVVMLED
jgi:hypothetical protein